MATKTSLTALANELERMPAHLGDARKAADEWRHRALRMVKKSPGRSLIGAFAVGFVVAKLNRLF